MGFNSGSRMKRCQMPPHETTLRKKLYKRKFGFQEKLFFYKKRMKPSKRSFFNIYDETFLKGPNITRGGEKHIKNIYKALEQIS
jgi:hypothetical protein